MWQKVKSLLFHNLTTRQTIAKNTFWLAVSNVGGRLIRAVVIIYAARVLGAGDWGLFSYAISAAALITIFLDLGVSPVFVREASKFREKPGEFRLLVSTSFIIKAATLLLGVVIIIFVSPLLFAQEGLRQILPFVGAIFVFDLFREFGFSLIRVFEKMEWEAALFFLTNAAIVFFGFIFIRANPTAQSFALGYAAGTGVGMIATMYVLRKNLYGIFSGFSWTVVKRILSSGWPLAIAAISGGLMIDTDIILLGYFRSAQEVGFYSAAQRVVQMLYLAPTILSISLLPTISRLANQNSEKVRRLSETALTLIYLMAMPLALGGVITGRGVVSLLYGAGYSSASLPFQILVLTVLLNFPNIILASILFAHNKQRRLTIYAAIAGASNAVLDLIFIPRFGMVGSAIVTVVAQSFGFLYLWSETLKIIPLEVIGRLKKILLAAAAMSFVALASELAGIHVLATMAFAAATYFGILLFLKEPVVREMKAIIQSLFASGARENNESSS